MYALFGYVLKYQWPQISKPEAWAMSLFTIFLVAPCEELIFRGIIPGIVKLYEPFKKIPIFLIGSQGVFAIFHVAAYGGVSAAMIPTFILGIILVYAAQKYSLYFTMGCHAAYNMCLLGIMTGGILT